jgi:hypothetical protein
MDEKYLQELVADNMDNEEYRLEQVFDELGRREVALKQGLTEQAADPDVFPDPPADETLMGIGDTFAEFGKRTWKQYEPMLYDLLCNPKNENHEALMDAFTKGANALAVALVPTLMTAVGALPAFVVAIATIVGKQLADAGLKAMCEMWEESLPKEEEASPEEEEG